MAVTKTKFTDSAGRDAWLGSDGKVYTEGGNRSTGYSQDDWNSRQAEKYGTPADQQEATSKMKQSMIEELIRLDEQMDSLPVTLTTAEMDNFLTKAIEQITPYYDKKKAEIEAGIKEGKIQTAEEILSTIREVQDTTKKLLSGYDITQAKTEEEFINTLADITATKDEDLALKRDDWKSRIEEVKTGQVKSDILTSGIGKAKIGDLRARQTMEEQALQRRAGAKQTSAETAKKYDLQTIALARQSAEQERVRRIGTPDQTLSTETAARGTLGMVEGQSLPSDVERARLQSERNISLATPEQLTDSEEERKKAIESRKLTLQGEEEKIRYAQQAAQNKIIQSKMNDTKLKLGIY
uniref:Uncharacterized protein n=1 Tax=viral metagenome TaxID=1070528 RepID=A0A6M3L0L3_9ZZZZ